MVYFMHAEGTPFIKIGMTSDVNERLYQFQIGNPHKLKVILEIDCEDTSKLYLESRKVEKELHDVFEDYRHRGEWFYLSKDMRSWINTYLVLDGQEEISWE